MKRRYVLLRTAGRGDREFTREPLRDSESALDSSTSSIRIEIDELDAREARRAGEDETVRDIAASMPLQLIHPTEDRASADPEPPGDAIAWGLRAVGADRSSRRGAGVKVAVLDTGIDRDHPAFAGVTVVAKNFTSDPDASDSNGHGTHCAGTIFGQDVGGQRIGIARGIETALIAKVLDGNGAGSTESVSQGMIWAESSGAHIISMSLSFDFVSLMAELGNYMPQPAAVSQALATYRDNLRLFDGIAEYFGSRATAGRGSLIVAASGNESDRAGPQPFRIFTGPPAASLGYVSVAALRPSDPAMSGYSVASFSNAGADIAAPGVEILSAAKSGGLRSCSGTSMATPHVAGVAALWAELIMEQTRRFALEQVKSVLLGNARFLDGLDTDDIGRGLVLAPAD